MKIEPYLFFEGRCEEAIEFYKAHLGAKPEMLMRYRESPEPPQPGCPAIDGEKIMHASFVIGDARVMASDGMASGAPKFEGFGLSLYATDPADAKRKFDALGAGGAVVAPLTKTFFSPAFGMVKDKFGVMWMVMVPGEMG